MSVYIKYFLFFFLFVLIQYVEGMPAIGGVSVMQLWKMPILLYLLYVVYKNDRKWFPFEKYSYLYSVENFFCPAIISNPFSIIIHASKQLPMVLFFNFWITRYHKRVNVLETILFSLAQFISLVSLLCLLGIVKPIESYKLADAYGADAIYYSALFGAVHAASSYFCIALFVLLFGFKSGRFVSSLQKVYNTFLIIVLLYSLYKSFVRTGWIMFGLGCFVMFFNKESFNIKKLIRYVFVLSIVGFCCVWLYNTSPTLRGRLTEKTVYNKSSEVNVNGSGRLMFWTISLSNYAKNDVYGLFFGKGYDAVVDDMRKEAGRRVFSHNHFVDTLAQYGLIGLILLLGYFYSIYRYIVRCGRDSPYYLLAKVMFISYFVFAFLQNEMYFWYAVIFSICLVLLSLKKEDYNSNYVLG